MMNRIRHTFQLCFFFLLCANGILAQNRNVQDSVLEFRSLIGIVKNHHPIIYRANIVTDMADAKLLKARGAFDPKIESSIDHKSFDDKNYYTLLQGGLNVPLWFGSDLKVNFDRNNGVFLNNSDFVPQSGLLGPGIDLELGRGLFNDSRRAVLRQAKIMQIQSLSERDIIINELLFKAGLSFTYWHEAQLKEELYQEYLQLAETRLDITRESFINGYMPSVDTLEAGIELQNRNQALFEIQQNNNNRRSALNNYLWLDAEIPLEMDEALRCDTSYLAGLLNIVDSLRIFEEEILNKHPQLEVVDRDLEIYGIDYRLSKENLKPRLRLSYSPLIDFDNQINNGDLFLDNYKMGAALSYPLFTRKERAEVQINSLKIQDTQLKAYTLRQKLNVELDIAINNIRFLEDQLRQIDQIVRDSKALLDAENEKFRIGESSVFLVNARENKYVQSREKQIEITVKLIQATLNYLFTLNQMSLI